MTFLKKNKKTKQTCSITRQKSHSIQRRLAQVVVLLPWCAFWSTVQLLDIFGNILCFVHILGRTDNSPSLTKFRVWFVKKNNNKNKTHNRCEDILLLNPYVLFCMTNSQIDENIHSTRSRKGFTRSRDKIYYKVILESVVEDVITFLK